MPETHTSPASGDADRRRPLQSRSAVGQAAFVGSQAVINGTSAAASNGWSENAQQASSLPVSLSCHDDAIYSSQRSPDSSSFNHPAALLTTNRGHKLKLRSSSEHMRNGRQGSWVPDEVHGWNRPSTMPSTLTGQDTDSAPTKRTHCSSNTRAGKRRKVHTSKRTVGGSSTASHDAPDLSDSDSDLDPSLIPAYPVLPPTPLTPLDVLHSTTLTRVFADYNRTFHQIALSATSLIEADLDTGNLVKEGCQVLRGDLAGRKWTTLIERQLRRKHETASHSGKANERPLSDRTDDSKNSVGEPQDSIAHTKILDESSSVVQIASPKTDTSKMSDENIKPKGQSAPDDEQFSNDHGNATLPESSDLMKNVAKNVPETATLVGREGATDSGTASVATTSLVSGKPPRSSRKSCRRSQADRSVDGDPFHKRRSSLDGGAKLEDAAWRPGANGVNRPDLLSQVYCDTLPWLTSLFVDKTRDVTIPFHAGQTAATSTGSHSVGQAQNHDPNQPAPNPSSSSSATTSMSGITAPASSSLQPTSSSTTMITEESLTSDQQFQSFSDCVFDLQRFLADMIDYRNRLFEIRDGCLQVEKRRRAMWTLVKVAAKGYEDMLKGGGPGGAGGGTSTSGTAGIGANSLQQHGVSSSYGVNGASGSDAFAGGINGSSALGITGGVGNLLGEGGRGSHVDVNGGLPLNWSDFNNKGSGSTTTTTTGRGGKGRGKGRGAAAAAVTASPGME